MALATRTTAMAATVAVIVVAAWLLTSSNRSATPLPATESVAVDCSDALQVVVLGASYAKGWTAEGAPFRMLNAGREGEESWKMLERFDRDVVQAGATHVILWGFINDIFRSPRQDIDATTERTRRTIQEMVAQARAHSIEPILATEITIRGPKTFTEAAGSWLARLLGRSSYQDFINARVKETNEWIRSLAATDTLQLLDFERVLADADGRRTYQFAADDGSHVSAAGYQALTQYAVPRLAHYLCRPLATR